MASIFIIDVLSRGCFEKYSYCLELLPFSVVDILILEIIASGCFLEKSIIQEFTGIETNTPFTLNCIILELIQDEKLGMQDLDATFSIIL